MTTMQAIEQADGSVSITISGAPTSLPPSYASSFTSTTDGWAAAAGATVTRDAAPDPDALKVVGGTTLYQLYYATKTITGLTVGQSYRLSAYLYAPDGTASLEVDTGAATASAYYPTRGLAQVEFTATATSHVVKVSARRAATAVPNGVTWADTIRVETTLQPWRRSTLWRFDANGMRRVRKGPAELDIPAGVSSVTVKDWEAALTASVSYEFIDSDGVSTEEIVYPSRDTPVLTAPATVSATGTAQVAPRSADTFELVTGYDEEATSNGTIHTVIGRADPIGNPGPLSTRAGTLEFLCANYNHAKTLRLMYAPGDVVLLRQPWFNGFDLYHLAQSVRISQVADSSKWTVTVRYTEVAAP